MLLRFYCSPSITMISLEKKGQESSVVVPIAAEVQHAQQNTIQQRRKLHDAIVLCSKDHQEWAAFHPIQALQLIV